MPSVDELFPEQPKSVDDLFPADIEKNRYRRDTLGTSPIQDLIFGDTSVNPIARVLDAFGQGAKQGWGADPAGLSQESADHMKRLGVFNDYDKGQKSIIKAANESLFRGAAVGVVDPVMRGLPALFSGLQAATAQIGTEAGQEKLGREAAGAFEAFPSGLRAPTGIPHAAPHPMLAEIERARSLGVIGAGEEGYLGTRPAEVAPPISSPQETPKAAGMPVDLFIDPRAPEAKPVDVAPRVPEDAVPQPGLPEAAPVDRSGPSPIVEDVAQKLIAAGRPEAEARASGELIASHYEARSERFGGQRGTAEEMYAADAPSIRAGDGIAPTRSEIRPGEGDATPAVTIPEKPSSGGAAEAVKPEAEKAPVSQAETLWEDLAAQRIAQRSKQAVNGGFNGDRTRNGVVIRGLATQTWEPGNMVDAGFVKDLLITEKQADGSFKLISKPNAEGMSRVYESKPHEGISKTGETVSFVEAAKHLRAAPKPIETVPELKTALRGRAAADPQTWSLYEFLAKEGGLKPTADLKSIFGGKNPFVPGFGPLMREGGLTMDEALTRAKENSYVLDPNDIQHTPGAANKGELTWSVNDLQDMIANESRGQKNYRNTHTPTEKVDPGKQAHDIIAELHQEVEATGGDVQHIDSAIEHRVVEMVQKGNATDVMDAYERAIMEVEYNQIKRGKITFRGDAKPIITLFKDANASTFVHETGHAWLEELMKDAEHPKSPASLRDDADAVQRWLGVHSAEDIKTSHHEKFARGFERYMMEGKAPSQALANVFAKFKDWLTRIYQSVTRLKSPINDEIRGVFDRLLTMHPSEVKIEPEGPPKTFADIHETDALHTKPENAHPVAETIQAERDMLAHEHIPEEHDARLDGVTSEAGRREARGPQPLRDGNETPRPEEAGNNQASGAVGEGGSVAPAESPRPSVGGGKTEPPVSAQTSFAGPESPLVDKAGNIRLENLGTAEDVNKAIRDAAAENNDFIDARRGVVTDGQVLELADALGMDAGQLNQRKLGQAYNAEQIMAARKLLIQSATTVRDAMVKAAAGAEVDVMAYAEAKARHQLIQEQVSGITAEAGRALRAFRRLEGQQEAGQIDAFLRDATGKTLFQLQREAQLGSQLPTPAQVSKFVNDTSKPTWKEMVVEAWMSSLLSGAKTHLANIMGNTISGLWRPLETVTSAAIGKARNIVTGSEDRVLFGEAAAELFGMVHGSKEGIVAAYKAFKSEEPQMTSTRQIEQGHPKALPSVTVNVFGREMELGGKQARIPLRLLGAEDEFFKSVAFRGDINRQAYALAAKENLPPEQFNARVAELSANPTEEMATKAKEIADYQTFQTPLGKVGRSVQNFANSHLLAKFIVPFVRTPINLLKYAGERTPLGLFAQEVRDNLSGKNGAVARDTQVARITLGTMVGVAAFEMASQGLITGGGPADKSKRAIMQADGWQDYSVRVGDMYYRYNRLDPFSVILGFAADAYEINHTLGSDHLDKEHLPTLIFSAISRNILNRASLQGMSDLIQAVNDPERYGKSYIKSMAGTVVPALSAQTAQTLDPIVRDTRTVLDGLKARIPGASESLMPKRDIWGEPVVREGGLGPDIASPIMERRIKSDPVNQALIAANYFPGKLDRKIRGVDLTDQQYDDYQRVAGRMAKTRLNAIVSIPGFSQMPEVTRKELMTNAITTSREASRSLIMMQNPEIIKKAADAKIAKQRGEPVH